MGVGRDSHADPTFFVSCCFCASQDGYLRRIAGEQPLFTHVACGFFTPGGCLVDAEKLAFAPSSAQCSYRGHYLVNPAVDLLRNVPDTMLREYAQSAAVRPFFTMDALATTLLADVETPSSPQFLLRPAFFKLPSAYTEKKLCDQQYLSCCYGAQLALRPAAARLSPLLPPDIADRARELELYNDASGETPRELRQEGGLCMYCRLSFGVTLRCGEPGCPAAYHFSCHYYAGGFLHVPFVTEYVGGVGHPLESFCPRHALQHGYVGSAQLRECLARNLRRCNPFMDMALAQELMRSVVGDDVGCGGGGDGGVLSGVSSGVLSGVSSGVSSGVASGVSSGMSASVAEGFRDIATGVSMDSSTYLSASMSMNSSMNASSYPPTIPPTNPPTYPSINPPTIPPTYPPTYPSTILPTNPSTYPPINPPTNPPTNTHTTPHHPSLLPIDQLVCDVCGYGYYCPRETMDCAMRSDVREPVHLQLPITSPRELDAETACDQLEAELEVARRREIGFAEGNRREFWVCCICACRVHTSCFDVSDYVPLFSRGGVHCGRWCATTYSLHLHAVSAQLRALAPRGFPPPPQRDLSALRPLPRVSGVHHGRISGAQAVRTVVAGKHLPSAGQRLHRQNRRLGDAAHLHPVRASPAEVLGHRGPRLPRVQCVREFRGERSALQRDGVFAGRAGRGVSSRWCIWAVWTVAPSSTSPPPMAYLPHLSSLQLTLLCPLHRPRGFIPDAATRVLIPAIYASPVTRLVGIARRVRALRQIVARSLPAGEMQLQRAREASDSLRQQMAQLLRRKSDPPRLQRHRSVPRFLSRRPAGGPAGGDPLGAVWGRREGDPGGAGAHSGRRNAPAAPAGSRGGERVEGGGGVGGVERGFPRGGGACERERARHVGARARPPSRLRESDAAPATAAAPGRRTRARPLLPIRGIPPLSPLRHRQRVRARRRRRAQHAETPRTHALSP